MGMWRLLLLCLTWVSLALAQDYQVADISCDVGEGQGAGHSGSEGAGRLSARLRKPDGFKGHPLFADDRTVDPLSDPVCQIRPAGQEGVGVVYQLLVTDISRCGTVSKNGYVTLRVWFPQLARVVLATDQEVIIMCRPAAPTVIKNRAAGFAGSLPPVGRVSGVVQEDPGNLEYEVALYREVRALRHGVATTDTHHHAPVDQAVPIGSRLQLRASINTESMWKHVKLLEVTVSSSPEDPYRPGYVSLVATGCRVRDFTSIVPQQPRTVEGHPGEVTLDFEAFMLDSRTASSSQLWIHATIQACREARDCVPELCMDLYEPSGYGRRRRRKVTHYAEGLLEVAGDTTLSLSALLPGRSSDLVSPAHTLTPPSIPTPTLHNLTTRGEGSATGRGTTPPMAEALAQSRARTQGPPERSATRVGSNVGVTVIMPEEFFTQTEALYQSCVTFMVLCGLMSAGLVLGAALLCLLTSRLNKTVARAHSATLESVIKDHQNKYGLRDFLQPPFQ